MRHSGIVRTFGKGAMLLLFAITLQAQAATFSFFGNIEFNEIGSNINHAEGQLIRDALNQKYAGFTFNIDTSSPDLDPDPNKIELRNAVTSTVTIDGITLGLNTATRGFNCVGFSCTPIIVENPCSEPSIDCRVTVTKNIGIANGATQLIFGQLHSTSALGVAGTLSSAIFTSGSDLFTIPRQKIVDPFLGNTNLSLSVFFFPQNVGMQRINFNLTNITATPVPEPETYAMFGLGLMFIIRRKLTQR